MELLNIIWDNSIELFAPGGRTKGDLKKVNFKTGFLYSILKEQPYFH